MTAMSNAQVTDQQTQDVRGVLIQIAGGRLLLPNATIAEVMSYADPEPIANTPDWMLGRIRWRGWQVPLIAFARLSGIASGEAGGLGSKVIVLKALGGDAKAPYFAMLTQGFPRLVTVSRETVVTDAGDPDEAMPEGVQARVLLNEDHALLPDLERVETMIGEALKASAA
jgi:chemosensory pili system protein ChpC